MEREVFVLANGETFSAWDLSFSFMEEHSETSPLKMQARDGNFLKKGTITFTVKAGTVHFHAVPGTAQVGRSGQLSSREDWFWDVTISTVEPAAEHDLVSGKASRKLGHKIEP